MYKVEVHFPGKIIRWNNGHFRTPGKFLIKNDKELKHFKAICKALAIPEKSIKIEKMLGNKVGVKNEKKIKTEINKETKETIIKENKSNVIKDNKKSETKKDNKKDNKKK